MAISCSLPSFLRLFRSRVGSKKRDKSENGNPATSLCYEEENVTVSSKALQALQHSQPFTHSTTELTAWHQIDSNRRDTLDEHAYYWWKTSGYALATLLDNAGYTCAAQLRSLEFFTRSIAPRLGVANKPGVKRWKSFMTDDHNPIELSWDWHTGHKAPQIRFSVEPVGLQAGTAQDPDNRLMASDFTKMIVEDLPTTNMQWFNHFESYFGYGMQQFSPSGHQSSIFWAFDLDEEDVVCKAYFFPEYRASATRKTTLHVISDAIETAPASRTEALGALYMFQEFAQDHFKVTSTPLEMDMLAIDLIEPLQSRFKIYFRSRQTSFQSVRNAMTLGGRVTNSDMEVGLTNLRMLWNMLFDQQGISDSVPLPDIRHRTAGLLFNVEFRLGSQAPRVKIYIPVRHYAQNDWQIVKAVSDYMDSVKRSSGGATQLSKRQTASAYDNTMTTIFGQDILRREKGRQTYIGCSVQPGGHLRVVSYVNPK